MQGLSCKSVARSKLLVLVQHLFPNAVPGEHHGRAPPIRLQSIFACVGLSKWDWTRLKYATPQIGRQTCYSCIQGVGGGAPLRAVHPTGLPLHALRTYPVSVTADSAGPSCGQVPQSFLPALAWAGSTTWSWARGFA